MRTPLLIILAAATTLSAPAIAREHGRHHHGDRHRRHHVAYVAPYRDWSYRRVSVGYRLRPAFYGPRYVITDYGLYGLRRPGRHLRWIRYGNDLLLVDVRRGRVVEVLPGGYLY